jgi:outer membrane protein
MRSLLYTFALVGTAAGVAAAQTPAAPAPAAQGPTPVLTIEEAVALARRNNPVHLSNLNNRNVAAAQRRSAYGAFLPNVEASFGSQYREGGGQFFNGATFGATSATLASSYDLTAVAQYNAATFIAPRLQHANVRAAEADAANSEEQLRANVTRQYLTVLQQQARAQLQDTLVATAQVQLELSRARVAVGSGTALDVARSEVTLGQAQVAALQARNLIEVEKVRLFQQLGIAQPGNVELTSDFTVGEFQQSLDDVLALARRVNPAVNAARSRENVAGLNYRTAQSQYTPTLQIASFWGGFTNQFTDDGFVVSQALGEKQGPCLQAAQIRAIANNTTPDYTACNAISLTPQEIQSANNANSAFPFNFERNPWTVQASLSIPLFNGLQREQRVQEANAQRADARYDVRAQELALTANVTAAYLDLTTSQRTIALQEQNARTAREALTLAEERFRVGANTFVDVAQARADFERAETDRINAIYDYHRAYAALQSAVGRPLR